MNSIDPDQKVAEIVEQHPQTYRIFSKYGCPDMRKGFFSYMARIMSIRNAARIHRISLDELINDLQESISGASNNKNEESNETLS